MCDSQSINKLQTDSAEKSEGGFSTKVATILNDSNFQFYWDCKLSTIDSRRRNSMLDKIFLRKDRN